MKTDNENPKNNVFTPEKDFMEQIMGSMGWYHVVICMSVFLNKITIAFHLISHAIMVPKQNLSCSDPNYKTCDPACPDIIMDTKYYDHTIINDFGLYCDRSIYATMSQMAVMIGVFFGNIIFGIITDKFGRKIPFIICSIMPAPVGVAVIFSPNIWCFIILKFVLNLFVGGSMCTGFVLFTELVGVNWRAPMGILFHLPFVFGHGLLSLFAYFLRNWLNFQVLISAPNIIFIYYFWVLPESPRWLFITGKLDKCVDVLTKIAIKHKRPTENIRTIVETEFQKKGDRTQIKKGRLKDLFSGKYISFLTVTMWANWFGVSLGFYGAAQYIGQLGGNIYISNTAVAVAQIPGVLVTLVAFQYWGRKYPMVIAFAIPSVAFLINTVLTYKKVVKIAQIAMAAFAMFGLGAGFPGCYVFSSELFPTTVRNVGVGSSSMMGRVGAIIAAYVADIKVIWLPSMIFGLITGLVAIMNFFLPETRGIRLPDTNEEAKNIKGGKKIPELSNP